MQYAQSHSGVVPHPGEELANALTHGVGAAAALAGGAVLVTLVALFGDGWQLAGGVAYTAGTFFYMRQQLRWSHAIWHGFVIAGSVCHYVAVMLHLL